MADDYVGNKLTTGHVTAGGSATGTLEIAGDLDWFAISLTAGKDYIFTLESGATNGLPDPYLKLYSSDGTTLISESDDFDGLNSEIDVHVTASGTYYLEAGSGTYGSGIGPYVLTSSLPIVDDYAAGITTTGLITPGSSKTGTLEIVGDSDWFAISLVAGKQYTFNLDAGTTDGLPDPSLSLYRSDGSLITANDDTNELNSEISYSVVASGTYYLGASSGPNDTGKGSYTLTSSAAFADDYLATNKTTGAIVAGGSTTGQLEMAGDSDWFAISLTAGQQYSFTLNTGTTNGLEDPLLSLYGSSGTLITSNDDADLRNSQISYTPTTTGTFYLGASSGSVGTGKGSYTLASSYPSVNGITVVTGSVGNDTMNATAGDGAFDGGSGSDTIVFNSNRSQYTIVKTPAGYKVFDNSGTDGVDSLAGIEKLQFADQTIDTTVLTAASYETVVQQLYIAYFGRPADTGGLLNQENTLLAAGAPTDIAGVTEAYKTNSAVRGLIDLFGTSAESGRLYAGSTTTDFVTAIYTHVLNRPPLSAGLSFWTNALDTNVLTRGNAALSIMSGALANTTTQGLLDASAVINKAAVATNFTFNIDTASEISGYVGQAAAAKARDMLQVVTDASEPIALQSTVTSTLVSLVTPAAIPMAMEGMQDAVTLVGIAHSV